ncbi:MAG: alginate export family protein [Gammaproteobacteria bacterium]|nr:alginate export family protein [Gammaproteobacteria bacterium]MBQ0840760.1 alginate export family protein [Gammaproteobacteria bacterium]
MLKKFKKTAPAAAISMAVLGLSAPMLANADLIADSISKALNEGDIALNLRYRYEYVDQDGKPEDANASTLRSRITMKSGAVGGFTGLVEVDNVSYIGSDNFNNTENGKADYPAVADPDYTEINQAFISYAFDDKNTATVGRQRINHSGQRFLGGVGWRQNEQTFDAASLKFSPIDGLTIDYSYIWDVNRIFGPEGADADFEGDSHALIATYKIADGHTISGFSYLLDLDEAPALSSSTYGLEYKGGFKVSDAVSLGVNLSYAEQSDYKDSALDYDAGYYFAEISAKTKPVTVALGYEVLESDNGVGFKTPLATLHKFQGFADMFLVTPAGGIEDTYLKVATKVGGVKLIAFYHDFEAETGGMDYGSEIDLIAAYKFGKNYSVLFKYAAYDADDYKADTDKAWLMLTAAF